jgi:hypothetical protein
VIRLQQTTAEQHRQVFAGLRAAGIGVQLHYSPVHLQPYYRRLGFREGDFPMAEAYATSAMSLPLSPGLTLDDLKRSYSAYTCVPLFVGAQRLRSGLVGDAFEAAHHHRQRIERFERQLVFPKKKDNVLDQFTAPQIDAFFEFDGLAGEFGILCDEGFDRIVQHRGRAPGQFDELFAWKGRGHLAQFQQAPRDAFRVVADPFKFQIDADGTVNGTNYAALWNITDSILE